MGRQIDTFHHLGIITRDLAASVATYERLGFVFTPLSLPRIPLTPGGTPEQLGVANRCAVFHDNYLEMLGVVNAERWASVTVEQRGPFDIDVPLRRYEGLHVMHFASDDIDALREDLLGKGLQPQAIRPFCRLVDTPDGPQMMRAKTLAFPQGSHPEALFQIAQHETPELVLQPRFMQHPNGALSISETILCAADPDSVALKYAQHAGSTVRHNGSLRVVELRTARLIVVDPGHLGVLLPGASIPTLPFLAGFTVRADLAVTTDFFNEKTIPFRTHGDRLLVDANMAAGATLLFETPSAQR